MSTDIELMLEVEMEIKKGYDDAKPYIAIFPIVYMKLSLNTLRNQTPIP